MALQKQGGGLGSILCGEIWRRCFACLAVLPSPVRYQAAKIFTSTYETSFKQLVSWMVLHTALRFYMVFMILLTPQMLLTLRASSRLTYLTPLILHAAL
jgi:hypothetical protein